MKCSMQQRESKVRAEGAAHVHGTHVLDQQPTVKKKEPHVLKHPIYERQGSMLPTFLQEDHGRKHESAARVDHAHSQREGASTF